MPASNRFYWHELHTTDVDAATRFYKDVIGWTTQAWEGGADYTMWVGPGGPTGGIMKLSDEAKAMNVPPHWIGYVGVKNVADTITRVTDLGGRVLVGPIEMPQGERFAICSDPQGAAFAVHQRGPNMADQPDRVRGIGDFGWAELMSSDPDAGFTFYSQLFGWVKGDAMDMGPMGTYQLFKRPGQTDDDGGIMRLPTGMPRSAWLHYANVSDAAAVAKKVVELGGKVLHGPAEVPGGGQIVAFVDPQGAHCAVFAR